MSIKTTYANLDAAKAKIRELIGDYEHARDNETVKYKIAANHATAEGLRQALFILNKIEKPQ
jgi:hypothetical protein